jgi:tetratricopeptide (TPR) repeat protein
MKSPLLLLQTNDSQLSTSTIWQMAKLYLKLGQFNQALMLAYSLTQKDLSQQKNYQQFYSEAIKLGAEFAEEIEDFQRAAYYWEQLAKQNSQDADIWYGLGIAKANLQDYPGSINALNRCLQLNPDHPKAGSRLLEVQQLLR